MTAEPIGFAAVIVEHHDDGNGFCWVCEGTENIPWPCLPYRLAVEAKRFAGKVARVEFVKARVMDHKQFLTEGPMIGRLLVESWLDRALADQPEQSQP